MKKRDEIEDLTFEDLKWPPDDSHPGGFPTGWRRVLGVAVLVAFVIFNMVRAAGLL